MTREPAMGGMDDLARVLSALLRALHSLGFVGRHLDPERLGGVLDAIGEPDDVLRSALEGFEARDTEPGDEFGPVRAQMIRAAEATLAGFDGVRASVKGMDLRGVGRALRREAVALEALYPLAAILAPVDGFFLEAAARADTALRARLAAPGEHCGIMHAANGIGERGGFSLFVPESYRPEAAHPLLVALHGGSGHGRAFLWNWVRTARSMGVIVACPTAIGQTWALGGPDMDSPNLSRVVDYVRARWNVDTDRLLLTGMSDGGTFTLLSGLQEGSPFTHLAPFATGFHPMLAEMADATRVRGLPIYLVHGALDWMFPVELAQTARRMLSHVGAAVTYREIPDLAHVYPREENAAVVRWLGGDRE